MAVLISILLVRCCNRLLRGWFQRCVDVSPGDMV